MDSPETLSFAVFYFENPAAKRRLQQRILTLVGSELAGLAATTAEIATVESTRGGTVESLLWLTVFSPGTEVGRC